MRAQMERATFAYRLHFENEAAEGLARKLVENLPSGMDKIFFVSGGSEAVESAIKLARQWTVATGQASRWKVIGRMPSYHGGTYGSLAVTGDGLLTDSFAGQIKMMPTVPAPFAWRDRDNLSMAQRGEKYADMLEDRIQAEGPESVLAFIMEPIGGAATNALVAPDSYYARIRDICDRHGILLIHDEVMSGAGRTGRFLGGDHWDCRPDIVILSKGIGSGYVPLGAIAAPARLVEPVLAMGGFQHGHTYAGNPLACAAGLAVLQEMERLELIPHAARMGEGGEALAHRRRARQGPDDGDRARRRPGHESAVPARMEAQPAHPRPLLRARADPLFAARDRRRSAGRRGHDLPAADRDRGPDRRDRRHPGRGAGDRGKGTRLADDGRAFMTTEALIVIDVQNDFCPGGALAVAGGDAIVPLVNSMIAESQTVVLTQDWHPAGHSSFASTHPGAAPFSSIDMPYGPQTLWPDHCIQGSAGARFHPGLAWDSAQLVVRKGFRTAIDSYSAFFENDHKTPTGLAGYLRERGIERLTMVGLATDYCVAYSALDAVRQGFAVTVRLDACRAIDLGGSLDAMLGRMREAGIFLT